MHSSADQPAHPLTPGLTAAARTALLTSPGTSPPGTNTLSTAGGLRPCRYMRENRWTLAEIVRWLDETTENYGQ